MGNDEKHVYGEIDNKTNLHGVFLQIRHDVDDAKSRSALTELYRRAGYLITLSHSPAWEKKFGDKIEEIRDVGKGEFATTAKKINRRAKEIGTEADYDETWGEG